MLECSSIVKEVFLEETERKRLKILPLREPQQLDELEADMTLCVAAIARVEKRFLTASDLKLSTEIMSTESRIMKLSLVGENPRWTVMFAGDPTYSAIITSRVSAEMKRTGARSANEGRIATFFVNTFQDVLRKKIEDELLSPYGLTREQFIQNGRQHFGDELFAKMLYQINEMGLGTEFLVGNPESLMSIRDPGVVRFHNHLGFHAIGSGATIAIASLMENFDMNGSIADISYRLLEAKFRGESALGVGPKTMFTLIDLNGTVFEGLNADSCEKIRKIWQEKGRPPTPQEYLDFVRHPATQEDHFFEMKLPDDYPY